jgi:hypothetical protein
MAVGSKVKRAFLSGIALCIISVILLVLGTMGLLSKNSEIDTTYFFVPLFFLATGIIAIALSREKTKR